MPGAQFFLEDQNKCFFCPLVKGFTFLKRVQSQFKMLLEMCLVPVSIASTERNANLFAVLQQLRDPIMVVESVGPRCLFSNLFYLMLKFNQPNID